MSDQEKTIFPSISFDQFKAFHDKFSGDTARVCCRCRGGCEDVKVVTLYPGESRYLAHKLNADYDKFLRERIDIVKTPYGFTEIFRIRVGGCAFRETTGCALSSDFRPVQCALYPLLPSQHHGVIDFRLDTWCPLVKHLDASLAPFMVRGYNAARKVAPSPGWVRSLDTYSTPRVNYGKLVQLRGNQSGPHAYDWTDFHRCAVMMAPEPHLVDPDEKTTR